MGETEQNGTPNGSGKGERATAAHPDRGRSAPRRWPFSAKPVI
jgi:hypothetical protein